MADEAPAAPAAPAAPPPTAAPAAAPQPDRAQGRRSGPLFTSEADTSIDAAAEKFDALMGNDRPPSVRGEDGRFAAKAETEEATAPPAEPKLDTPQEPTEAEGEEAPIDERFKIQLDDNEEVELTPEELREAVRESRKAKTPPAPTLEMIQAQRALEAERQQIHAERQHYARSLQTFLTGAQQQMATEFSDIRTNMDLRNLAASDPARFTRWQAAQYEIASAQTEQNNLYQRQQTEYDARRNTVLAEEHGKLVKAVPVFADPAKAQAELGAVRSFLNKQGFSDPELSQLTDHRTVLVARKAMLYDQMIAANPAQKRAAPTVTRIVRPGAAKATPTSRPNERSANERSAAQANLKKTGSVEALAAVFRASGIR